VPLIEKYLLLANLICPQRLQRLYSPFSSFMKYQSRNWSSAADAISFGILLRQRDEIYSRECLIPNSYWIAAWISTFYIPSILYSTIFIYNG
jgi:hypothetical protein